VNRLHATLVALGVALSACEESKPPPPPPAKPKPPKAAEAAPVRAPESEQALAAYSYNAVGKRDPFRGFMVDGPRAVGDISKDVPCSEPLCRFDLEDLNLVAVVSGDANPFAMVEDKSSVGYIVRRYAKVGKNSGKVTAILRDCIQVTSYPQVGPDQKKQPVVVEKCVRVDQRMASPLDLMKNRVD
jgi:type IV pilus assembly protein PilP